MTGLGTGRIWRVMLCLGRYCVLLRHYRALLVMICNGCYCCCVFEYRYFAQDLRKSMLNSRLPSYIRLPLLMPVKSSLVLLTYSPIGIRHGRRLQVVILRRPTTPSQNGACSDYLITTSCCCSQLWPVEQLASARCETALTAGLDRAFLPDQ